jgi:hypothetical protein
LRAALLVLVLAAPVHAGDVPQATATASKAEVSVGETFVVEVRANGPAGTTFTFPPEAAQDAFELHTAASASPPPPGTWRYDAAVFALGDAAVPPIPVRYRLADGTEGQVETAAVPLKVVSLLPKDKGEQKLADIRGPVGVGVGRAFWIALGAAVVVLAGLAFLLWSRRRRKEPERAPIVPALEPDEEARRALDALVASGRLRRAEYRPFYIELVAIAKRYLERRLDAPVVEMTTAEMLACLHGNSQAADLAPAMRDLAGAADRIKFARGAGLHDEAERHLKATRALVETLEGRLRPAAPQGGQAA